MFCDDLFQMLERDLKLPILESSLQNLDIRMHQKILYDITVLYGASGNFKPKFGFLEQDIVIGKVLKVPPELGNYFYRNPKKNEVFEPEIVIEIKNSSVNSHQLITYSQIASRIKTVFPRTRYYLVYAYCSVRMFEKVIRHGTHFDHIYNLCAVRNSELAPEIYSSGDLPKDLGKDGRHMRVYQELLQQLKRDLCSPKVHW